MEKIFSKVFIVHDIPFQDSSDIFRSNDIKSGIIRPKKLILEFNGTIEQLKEEIEKISSGISIEGIKKIHLKEKDYKFLILIQIYGQIVIPLQKMESIF